MLKACGYRFMLPGLNPWLGLGDVGKRGLGLHQSGVSARLCEGLLHCDCPGGGAHHECHQLH